MTGNELIENMTSLAVRLFGKDNVVVQYSNNLITEVTIKNPLFKQDERTSSPKFILLSCDSGQYFMSIDNFNWEFDKNVDVAK